MPTNDNMGKRNCLSKTDQQKAKVVCQTLVLVQKHTHTKNKNTINQYIYRQWGDSALIR